MPRTITSRPWSRSGDGGPRLGPAAGSTRDLCEQVLGDVEVGGHALDVVEILERFDEPQVLARALLVDLDRVLRDHRALRGLDRNARGIERLADVLEIARRRVHLDHGVAARVDVLGAGVDCREGHVVGILAVRGDRDQPAWLELPGDGAGAGELAAGLGEQRANVGGGPVAVVRRRLDQDRDAARAVALVDDLLELVALAGARRPLDRPLDVVQRHVDRARLVHREAQPVVRVRIAPTGARGDHDLPRNLGEDGPSLRVVRALLALDRGPLRVTGHRLGVYRTRMAGPPGNRSFDRPSERGSNDP